MECYGAANFVARAGTTVFFSFRTTAGSPSRWQRGLSTWKSYFSACSRFWPGAENYVNVAQGSARRSATSCAGPEPVEGRLFKGGTPCARSAWRRHPHSEGAPALLCRSGRGAGQDAGGVRRHRPFDFAQDEGKTRRRSYRKKGSKDAGSTWFRPPELVEGAGASALCSDRSRWQEKSNEVAAIPALLAMMAIEAAVVTIDAGHTKMDAAVAKDRQQNHRQKGR